MRLSTQDDWFSNVARYKQSGYPKSVVGLFREVPEDLFAEASDLYITDTEADAYENDFSEEGDGFLPVWPLVIVRTTATDGEATRGLVLRYLTASKCSR